MTAPEMVDQKPVAIALEPDTHYWCSCGLSDNQPFCKGAHRGMRLAPLAFEVAEKITSRALLV